uniref:Uncharacterized protein n=1 Tax=Glossina austeni TaxID=7395 RepID=A0A1A9VPB9_GLOAU
MLAQHQYFPYRNSSNTIPQKENNQHDDRYAPYGSQLDNDPPLQTLKIFFFTKYWQKKVVEEWPMPTSVYSYFLLGVVAASGMSLNSRCFDYPMSSSCWYYPVVLTL